MSHFVGEPVSPEEAARIERQRLDDEADARTGGERCAAVTRDGSRCRRRAYMGYWRGLCIQHRRMLEE